MSTTVDSSEYVSGRPTYHRPDGTPMYAVWGYSPTAKRVAILRYVQGDANREAL